MILTVTLNPLLERRFVYKDIVPGKENRNGEHELKAGGKGINVSRQLNIIGIDNLSLTFAGGNNGKIFRDIVAREGIKTVTVRTTAETREAALAIDRSKNIVSTFYSPNSPVSADEAAEFKNKLAKMMENCEMVIFSGSSPCAETDSIFPFGIKTANELDKISVCDTYGNHLSECIEAGPTIIHNNIPETESSLGRNLENEKSKRDYLDYLYSKNIKQVYLTDGGAQFYCSNFDYHFKVSNPDVRVKDATGSGDSFVAGLAFGIHNNLTFEESVRLAAAYGIENAMNFDAGNADPAGAEKWKLQVMVEAIGKIMKTLDVTPL